MNRFLLASGAMLALIVAALPANAQSYAGSNNAKDHDSTLGSAKYMDTKPQAQAAPAPTPTPAPQVEPSSGLPPVVDRAETDSNFHGLYVGAEGNYIAGGSDIRGWGGGGVIGYGWAPKVSWMTRPYLGLEAGFDWDGADSSTLAEKKNLQISLRPGAVFGKNLLGYGIVGYNRADFKSNVSGDKDWLNGWDVGAGFEVANAYDLPVGLRVEYTYANYESGDLGGASVNPHDNTIKLGVLYHFR